VAEEFLPIIHLVFSNLKTWLNGIHHGVSAKHLQAYLNEFTFRFNRRFYPFNVSVRGCAHFCSPIDKMIQVFSMSVVRLIPIASDRTRQLTRGRG